MATPSFNKFIEDSLGGGVVPSIDQPTSSQPQGFDAFIQSSLAGSSDDELRKISGVSKFLQRGAALFDVTAGGVIPAVVAPLTYGGARFVGASPEQAKRAEETVLQYTDRPLGKAFGITESPAYKTEGLNQVFEFIGQNMDKGADWIAQQTGLPKNDIANMMQTLSLGGGAAAGKTIATVKQIPGKMFSRPELTPEAFKAVETVGQGVERAAAAAQPAFQAAANVAERFTPFEVKQMGQMFGGKKEAQTGPMGSVGAAGAEEAAIRQGNIDAAVANTSPVVQQYVGSLTPDNVNVPALEIKGLEEKHGVQLTTGQRTGDTARYSSEWNQRGGEGNPLGERFGSQPAELAGAVDNARIRNAPDINDIDPSNLGQLQINGLAAKDQMRLQQINQAYADLTAANGGQFPIDIGTLQTNIKNGLSKELKTSHISDAILKDLQEFYGDPTFEKYEALRTNLANEMRSSSNGNARAAAWIVRNELEKLPVFGEGTGSPQAIQLKQLADKARSLVKERSDVIRTNPAYKAAVKEYADASEAMGQGESLNAAKFHQKYVANATPEAIRRMKSELLPDDVAHQAIAAGEFERIKNNLVNVNENNVKSEMFASFLKKNAGVLKETLGPQGFKDAVEIGLLSSKIAKPSAGTFNYSNTWSAMLGDMAKEGLVSGLEAKLAMSTGGASIPVVGGVRQLAERVSKGRFAASSLDPLGGIALKDLGKKTSTKPTIQSAQKTYGEGRTSTPIKEAPKVSTKEARKTYQPGTQVKIRDIVKD